MQSHTLELVCLFSGLGFILLCCWVCNLTLLLCSGCADEESWPDLDHGLVCGECKVLVNHMSSKYGGLCDNYCHAIGKQCVGAWEEAGDTCTVEHDGSCSVSFGGTSDAICECSPDPVPGALALISLAVTVCEC